MPSRKSHKPRKSSKRAHPRRTRHRRRRSQHRRSRASHRRVRGGQAYAPAGYTPVGTIDPKMMADSQYYIPLNPNVSQLGWPLSTTNPPLPPLLQ